MESKHEVKQESWPNNFTFPKQIHNDPCSSIYNLLSLCYELGRNPRMSAPTPKVQRPDRPINWESSVLLALGCGQVKLPLRLMDVQQLESVAMSWKRPNINFDHLNFPIPKIPLISCIPKTNTSFFGPAVQARSVVGEKCHWSEAMITQAEPGIFDGFFCEILVFLLISEHYRNCEVPI